MFCCSSPWHKWSADRDNSGTILVKLMSLNKTRRASRVFSETLYQPIQFAWETDEVEICKSKNTYFNGSLQKFDSGAGTNFDGSVKNPLPSKPLAKCDSERQCSGSADISVCAELLRFGPPVFDSIGICRGDRLLLFAIKCVRAFRANFTANGHRNTMFESIPCALTFPFRMRLLSALLFRKRPIASRCMIGR